MSTLSGTKIVCHDKKVKMSFLPTRDTVVNVQKQENTS